jgi:hypothetical protein
MTRHSITNMRCADCKHWLKGKITTFLENATEWDGKRHRYAGQSIADAPLWDCHTSDQTLGWCTLAQPLPSMRDDQASGPRARAVCGDEGIYGELVTDARFGCVLFEPSDSEWDHYRRSIYPPKGEL